MRKHEGHLESDFRDQVRSGDTLEQAGGSQGGEVVRFELYFEGRVNSVNVSFILKHFGGFLAPSLLR